MTALISSSHPAMPVGEPTAAARLQALSLIVGRAGRAGRRSLLAQRWTCAALSLSVHTKSFFIKLV